MSDEPNTAKTVQDLMERLHGAQTITVEQDGITSQILMLPTVNGMSAHDITKFIEPLRLHPKRRIGTAILTTLESFIDHVNRFSNADTALFADRNPAAPGLLAVIDYHQRVKGDGATGLAQFGQHRAVHKFPLSEEWQAWKKFDGQSFKQAEFAAFLEERLLDILPPPIFGEDLTPQLAELLKIKTLLNGTFAGPEKMVELSRGLTIHESSKVGSAVNLASGEQSVVFESEHVDGNGEKLSVPSLFCIGIPVFEAGDRYQVAVRLRYRKASGALVWFYDLYREDRVFKEAFEEACQKAAKDTSQPLFYGTPEAAQ